MQREHKASVFCVANGKNACIVFTDCICHPYEVRKFIARLWVYLHDVLGPNCVQRDITWANKAGSPGSAARWYILPHTWRLVPVEGLVVPLTRTMARLQLLTHLLLVKMAAMSPTTFSVAFSWMKILEFRFKFHWNVFLRVQLTISQHWCR